MLNIRQKMRVRCSYALSLFIMLFLFFGCSLTQNPSEQSLKKYLEAREHYRTGNGDIAVQMIESVVKNEGKNFPQAQVLLGRMYFLNGENDKAEKALLPLYKRDSSNQEAGLWLLKTLINQKKLDEAQQLLERLLSRNPEDPRLLYQMARLYELQDAYSQAITYYAAVIDYSEEIAIAHLKRGEIFQKLGNTDKAIYELGRAVSVIPSESQMASTIIGIYRDLKKKANK